ncbi:hypothetical protein [Phycicoccus ginsengisoli]
MAAAWFDVTTANSADRLGSVPSPALVELPLALALVVAAARRVHRPPGPPFSRVRAVRRGDATR